VKGNVKGSKYDLYCEGDSQTGRHKTNFAKPTGPTKHLNWILEKLGGMSGQLGEIGDMKARIEVLEVCTRSMNVRLEVQEVSSRGMKVRFEVQEVSTRGMKVVHEVLEVSTRSMKARIYVLEVSTRDSY